MVCSNCGYALGPDDQFCGGCGAYLTEAPEEEVGAPSNRDHWGDPYAAPPPRRSGAGPAVIAGVLAAVLVGALLIFWLTRPDDADRSATAPTTPVSTATSTDATTDPASPTVSPSETPSESPSESPSQSPTTATPETIQLPGSAAQCSSVGGLTVYKGNSATSCPFAENVARAYAQMDPAPQDEVTLTDVSSPVTGQDYTLTCSYTSPVRCTGGNNAVIFLATP